MKVGLSTLKQTEKQQGLWVLPIWEGDLKKVCSAEKIDPKSAAAWGFEGKKGQSHVVCDSPDGRSVLLLGAGKRSDWNAETARSLIARCLRSCGLGQTKLRSVFFRSDLLKTGTLDTSALCEALAEGAILGSYSFTQLKKKGTTADQLPRFPDRCILVFGRLRNSDRQRFRDGETMAQWTAWARDLLNQSQSHISARQLANHARNASKKIKGVRCMVMSKKEIAAAKMGLFLAVNQGSSEPPQLIVLQYPGGRKGDKPICLVGKGLTFDTGGYNLKPGESMLGMHMDKGGGVGALASFFAAAEMRVKRNLVCLVPATDNRVSANAMLPGDVYTAANGMSVEIGNTDAEGRMVLADTLSYAKKFNPSHMIDLATLTGAAVVALGDQASALFCDDDSMVEELLKQGPAAGELVWRMPLWKQYQDKLRSTTADIKNVGNRWGGAITAALFLQRFVPDGVKWCHIDMAGKMRAESEHAYTPNGSAFGFGPALLARWLRDGIAR